MLANLGGQEEIPELQNNSSAVSPPRNNNNMAATTNNNNDMDIDEGQLQPNNIHINSSDSPPTKGTTSTHIFSKYALHITLVEANRAN